MNLEMMIPVLMADAYKFGHFVMYQSGTEEIYTNFTGRSNKLTPDQLRALNERSYENWFRGMVGGEAKYQEAIRTNSWYNPYSKENYVPD